MLLSQMRLRLIEEHEANSKDGRFSSVAIAGVPRAPSRLPPADDSQGPFGRVSDMATGIRHVPPSEVRGCTGTPTGLGLGLVTEQGIGWSRGAITSGSVSKSGGTPVLEAPATGSCTGIPAEIEIPEHPCQKVQVAKMIKTAVCFFLRREFTPLNDSISLSAKHASTMVLNGCRSRQVFCHHFYSPLETTKAACSLATYL